MKYNPIPQPEFYKFNTAPVDLEMHTKILNTIRAKTGLSDDAAEHDDGIITDYWIAKKNRIPAEIEQERINLWYEYFMYHNHENLKYIIDNHQADNFTAINIWTQITTGNAWHPPHDHGIPQDLSFCWYLKFDAEAGHRGTSFWHGHTDFSHEFTPVEGDIYFWPSHLQHYQPPSFSNEPRIILSGNLMAEI